MKTYAIPLFCCVLVCCISCGKDTSSYAHYEIPQQKQTPLTKVDTMYLPEAGYTDESERQLVEATYTSDDRLCEIKKYPSYYDVTLNYENGSPAQVGTAYAETLLKAFPEYETAMEPYLYEIFRGLTSLKSVKKYDSILPRMNALLESLPSSYKEENIAFAKALSNGESGLIENGKISYEEAILLQMIPDTLRGTACSAVGLWGEKTASGQTIMCRNLEWLLGSENQMCRLHAVVHMKNGTKSLTNITCLGLNGIYTAINDDGVFAGILDVGSNDEQFEYENKSCYTYALRYALEHFETAEEVGKYMVSNSRNFTFSHNIALSDTTGTYCAEDAVSSLQEEKKAYSVLRKADTPLLEKLDWSIKDSLCILNSFATKSNQDSFTGEEINLVRFAKYKAFVNAQDTFTIAEVKEMLTQEEIRQNRVTNVHRNGVFHTIIIDYETKTIHGAFTGTEGVVNKPVFLDLGRY